MNKTTIILTSAIVLTGCGGSGQTINSFEYPTLNNGTYSAVSTGSYPGTNQYSAILEITYDNIKLNIEGYPPIVTSKAWVNDIEFDGTNAKLVIDPSEVNPGGYQVFLDRDGEGWFTRVYTNWRYWEFKRD